MILFRTEQDSNPTLTYHTVMPVLMSKSLHLRGVYSLFNCSFFKIVVKYTSHKTDHLNIFKCAVQ